MPVPRFALGAPCWIDLCTNDAQVTREFYSRLAGWKIDVMDARYGGYAMASRDGVEIAGIMAAEPGSSMPDAWTVYLAVDDVRATLAEAVEAGSQVLLDVMHVPEKGLTAMITVPGGAAVGLWEAEGFEGFGLVGEPGAPFWFELMARDYDECVAFHREVLGWDVSVRSDTEQFRYSTHGAGMRASAGLMDAVGYLPEDVPAHWRWYLGVEDADAAVALVAEMGGKVLEAPSDSPFGRMASILDPNGAALMLAQRT